MVSQAPSIILLFISNSDMKIVLKIALLFGLLLAMAWHYQSSDVYKQYLWAEADQTFQVEKVKNCDVVYTSASSNFSQAAHDNDMRKISQMMEAQLNEKSVEAFNIPGSHAGTHKLLLKLIPENSRIKTAVVTVNMRSFGLDWRYSELETPQNKRNVMYAKRPALLNRFLVSLNAYDNKSPIEREQEKLDLWETTPLPFEAPRSNVKQWFEVEKWGDWRQPKRQLADQFIKQYAFVLDDENPRIKDFEAITTLCKERDWKLVFHILPENIERTVELVDKDLADLMQQNAAWFTNKFEAEGITVVNNISLLPDSCFTDRDFPTEHYNDLGRMAIAKEIAKAI